jgi:hypothetical protein
MEAAQEVRTWVKYNLLVVGHEGLGTPCLGFRDDRVTPVPAQWVVHPSAEIVISRLLPLG